MSHPRAMKTSYFGSHELVRHGWEKNGSSQVDSVFSWARKCTACLNPPRVCGLCELTRGLIH